MTTFAASVTIVDLPVGTTVTGAELIEAVQTTAGVGQSVQLSINQIMTFGGMPTGGATGTILNKTSASNFSTQFSAINTFVSVGTALATSGSATSIVAFVPNNAILSTQLANNAIGTNQLASSVGIASTLSVGTNFTVGGTANVSGTETVTGTATFNGGIVGNGTLGITGNSVLTGTLGVVGTSIVTGTLSVIGTTNITGAFVLGNQATGILTSSGTGVVSAQGGMVLLNTLSPSAIASIADTSSITAAYRHYMVLLDNVCASTQTTTFQVTLATSGSAFTTAGYVSIAQTNVSSIVVTDTTTAAWLVSGTRSTTQLQTSTVFGVSGFIELFNPSSSVNNKTMRGSVMFPTPGAVATTTVALSEVNGVYTNASPVTGINFAFSSGNIATGTIKIYGIT